MLLNFVLSGLGTASNWLCHGWFHGLSFPPPKWWKLLTCGCLDLAEFISLPAGLLWYLSLTTYFLFFSFKKYSIYLFGVGSQLQHAHLSLQFMGSLVVLCELVSWPGIKPKFPALEGRFLTTGPRGKPLSHFFNQGKITHTCKKIKIKKVFLQKEGMKLVLNTKFELSLFWRCIYLFCCTRSLLLFAGSL